MLLLLLPALVLAADPAKQTLFGCNEERVELLCPAHTRCCDALVSNCNVNIGLYLLKMASTLRTIEAHQAP